MKTEGELLALFAKAHTQADVREIKDYLDEHVVYDAERDGIQPFIGKEKVSAKMERWFKYDRLFSVRVVAVCSPEEHAIGFISLKEHHGEVNSCVIIEVDEEAGLITRIYLIDQENTCRADFRKLKTQYFMPRLEKQCYNRTDNELKEKEPGNPLIRIRKRNRTVLRMGIKLILNEIGEKSLFPLPPPAHITG